MPWLFQKHIGNGEIYLFSNEYFRINLIQFNPYNPVKKWKIKYEPPNNITGLFHFNNFYYLLFFYLTIFSSLICVFNTSYAIIHPSSLYVNIFLFSYSFYNIVFYFHCFSVYFSWVFYSQLYFLCFLFFLSFFYLIWVIWNP